MTRAHSEFAPSATKRIIACPGSVAACRGKPDVASYFAAEGSVAHAISEKMLQSRSGVRRPGKFPVKLLGTTTSYENHSVEIDDEMQDGVQNYVDYVWNRTVTASKQGGNAWVENTVHLDGLWTQLSRPVPAGLNAGDIYGHLDCAIWFPKDRLIEIVDFKYGAGIPVEAEDNAQLMVYALGMLLSGLIPDWQTTPYNVRLTIVQPRAEHDEGRIRHSDMSVLDVLMWAEAVYCPAIEAALLPDPPLAAGSHCRYCGARNECAELRKQALAAARQDFTDLSGSDDVLVQRTAPPAPQGLTDDEVGEIMRRASMIETWIEAVRNEAAHRLEAGRIVPGWKLVPKRAQRKWTDETQAEFVLTNFVGTKAFVRKLVSPAQAEKLMGKKDFTDALGQLVQQVSTGTTLAPEHDPRPAVLKGGQQFTELPDE